MNMSSSRTEVSSLYIGRWLSYLAIFGLRMMVLPYDKVTDSFILQMHSVSTFPEVI